MDDGTRRGPGARAPRRCDRCSDDPATRCRRCGAPLCEVHGVGPGERCQSCEQEWTEGGVARRAAQRMFIPPLFVLCGGITFGALIPLMAVLPGIVGALFVAAAATTIATGTAVGTQRFIHGVARAQFLREHARALPEARLLRGHHHRVVPPPRRP